MERKTGKHGEEDKEVKRGNRKKREEGRARERESRDKQDGTARTEYAVHISYRGDSTHVGRVFAMGWRA